MLKLINQGIKMKQLKSNQSGIAHLLAILLIFFVIGAVGFAGYRIMQSRKTNTPTPKSVTSSGTEVDKHKKSWSGTDFAVKGTYADASVLKIADGKWRMYYGIQPEVQPNRLEVFSATSTDGKTWTQEAGTRKTMATFPNVVKTASGKYRMYFQQAGELKSAISTDGLSFADEAGTRIDKSNPANLTFDNVAAPTVLLKDDGTYMMVYRGTINSRYASDTPNPTTQVLLWATSTDGLSWGKKGLALDSRDDTLRGQLDGPDLVKWDDGKLHLFATTYAGVYESVFDGSKFSKPIIAFTLKSTQPSPANGPPQDVAPPGDPSVISINGTWYMYYGGPRNENGIHYATYGNFY